MTLPGDGISRHNRNQSSQLRFREEHKRDDKRPQITVSYGNEDGQQESEVAH